MRIKKIYIKNFKGIKEKKIIEFSNQTSLLSGPNGFGKTTVFDVLELCLTGKINRTFENKNVTKDTKDYIKPFYQNTKNEDVVIKVWLEKNCDENLIIVKFLSKDNDGRVGTGRRNKPCDFGLLTTYKEAPEDFDKDEFVPNVKNEIGNEDIDKFLDLNKNKFKIEKVFRLFNYLQQEDATFFLKKSENDRKDALGFLFQTTQYENELDRINNIYSKIKAISEKLKNSIDELRKEQSTNIEYNKLFLKKDFDFDKKDLFEKSDLSKAKINKKKYLEELDKLSSFITIFSPDEYDKKVNVKKISKKIKSNELIEYYVLKNMFEKNNYKILMKSYDLLNNEKKIQAYVLRNYINKYEKLKDINKKYDKYKQFLNIEEYSVQIEKISNYINEILPDNYEEYSKLLESRKLLLQATDDIDKSINEIIRLRNSLKDEIEKSKETIGNDGVCPYCGTNWKKHHALLTQFEKRENSLKQLSSNQMSNLRDYDNNIKENYLEPIKKYMNDYLKKHEKIDTEIIEVIETCKDTNFDFNEIDESFEKNCNFVWEKLSTYNELLKNTMLIKDNIEKSLMASKEVIDKIKHLHNISFDSEVNELESICSKDNLKEYIIPFNKDKQITIGDIEKKSNLLKSFLEENKQKYKYDYHKTNDDENLYKKYFDFNKEKFYIIYKDTIELKKDYIENKLMQRQNSIINIYEQRDIKINNVLKKLEELKEIYDKTIKNYKKNMANKIKIPFYIYTAKILQNYQQGMGVFLSTKENSDSIRFLTDSSSDHDAMHHLSSGQLAVVALAFSLAINKTYNISQNLKFLAIDDPIHEMDALNIHSFVELIRHEFLNDYQLILSTHNDSNALYIKYKLEKIKERSVKIINVQNQFFD